MVLSAFVSMAAPAKAEGPVFSKKPKPKAGPPSHQIARDKEAGDSRPPPQKAPPHKSLSQEIADSRRRVGDLKSQTFKIPTAQISRFPWKTEIATTVFWIGEQPTEKNPVPNHMSSWDMQWATSYGGFDDPDPSARAGYLPAKFTPQQNPFYVALPYNDINAQGHKAEAREVIPWFKDAYTGRYQSVCKGRWIAIRKGNRVCFAQWEDVGPFRTDDAAYVFGTERPKPNNNKDAGLDVSPAVRDFLGLSGLDKTDWRFVDFDEVPPGPWAEHGENNHFVLNRRKAEKKDVAMSRMGAVRGGS